ncbi:MAG: DUF3108 domain-containing protein, partial [Bacteroidota bacterium]
MWNSLRGEMALKTFLSAMLLVAFPTSTRAEGPSIANPVFQDGEWLRYKVKYGPFRLGSIEFHVQKLEDTKSQDRYRIDMVLDFRSSPFPGPRYEVNSNIVHPERLYSEVFISSRVADGDSIRTTRRYDLNRGTCFIEDYNRTKRKVISSTVLQGVGECFEAPSLWFFARSHAQTGGTYGIQNIVDTTVSVTTLRYKRVLSLLKIDAYEDPVRAREVTGVANWVGESFGGLSGEFRGWFSDDEASVPLRAHFKIFLGNVVLKLEEWHRPGWNPPVEHRTVSR